MAGEDEVIDKTKIKISRQKAGFFVINISFLFLSRREIKILLKIILFCKKGILGIYE